MDILNDLETNPIPFDEEEKRHAQRLLIGLLCALLITGLVFGGYMYLRKRHERQLAAAAELEVKKNAPKVEVFVDDALVNGKTTTLGGTVHNISSENLANIAVELQLRRRVGGGVDLRTVVPESVNLEPGARTRYNLQVATQDYISVTFARVIGGRGSAAGPFQAGPRTPRPPEGSPKRKKKVRDKTRTNHAQTFD